MSPRRLSKSLSLSLSDSSSIDDDDDDDVPYTTGWVRQEQRPMHERAKILSKQRNVASSPHCPAEGDIADAVLGSSQGKRRNDDGDTPASKVARLASVEESNVQHEETTQEILNNTNNAGATEDAFESPEAPEKSTTENIVTLLSDLWSDNRTAIEQALTNLADLCNLGITDVAQANEREIRRLGGHMAVVQVLKK
jgi:hypothetical protein